jgi:hypothetical protein
LGIEAVFDRVLSPKEGMMRRNQNDVFVLGDESLVAEPLGPRGPAPVAATKARKDGGSLPPLLSAHPVGFPAGSALGVRKLAVLGLGAAVAATLGALEFSSPGSAHPQADVTSSHAALVMRPVSSAPAPASHPVPVRHVVPKARPKHRRPSVRRRTVDVHHDETEREPNLEEAPESSSVEVPAPPPVPVTTSAPAPVPPPTVPSPPPAPAGGGSGSGEGFGFER